MVIEHDAHSFLLDEVFVDSALSTLNMSTTGQEVVGETGEEVEDANEVLDEGEEEGEDGSAFVLKEDKVDEGGGRTGIVRSCQGKRARGSEMGGPAVESVICKVFRELQTHWYRICWRKLRVLWIQ